MPSKVVSTLDFKPNYKNYLYYCSENKKSGRLQVVQTNRKNSSGRRGSKKSKGKKSKSRR